MKKLIFASLLIFGFIPNFSYATTIINSTISGSGYNTSIIKITNNSELPTTDANCYVEFQTSTTTDFASYWNLGGVYASGYNCQTIYPNLLNEGTGWTMNNGAHPTATTYRIKWTGDGGTDVSINAKWNGSTWENINVPPTDTSTHLISLTPLNNSTTSNPVTFTLQAYIAPEDIGTFIGVKFWLHNIDQNTILGGLTQYFNNNDIYLLDGFNATTSGYFNYSTTTILAEGNYRINAQIKRSYLSGWIVNPLSSINNEWNNQFIVGSSTFIGNISQNSFGLLNGTLTSSTGTIGTNCNPIKASGTFGFAYNEQASITACLAYLLIPDSGQLQTTLTDFKDNVATHFPLGYVTDFLLTMSTTSTTSLNIIDVQIPEGMAGTGATLKLDITHVFDPILNAKVDKFVYKNSEGIGQIATSTTLYEYTSFWWEMIIYILAGLYLLARILGMHLFDISFGSHGSLSDNSNKDDSYKLKTWLANNDSRGYIDINGKRYETQKQRKK
jgi:hypothetical protein